MDIFDAIQKRRSVRSYTGAPIPRPDLEKIVDAGRLAASGHNCQPWDFIVITAQAMIERMGRVCEWMAKAGAIIAIVLDPSTRYWLEDGAAAAQNMLLASTGLGYGSCWVEGGVIPVEEELKELLCVPASRRLLIVVTVGEPAEWPDKEKKPLEEVLHWEKF
jgi:nitroreductase